MDNDDTEKKQISLSSDLDLQFSEINAFCTLNKYLKGFNTIISKIEGGRGVEGVMDEKDKALETSCNENQ